MTPFSAPHTFELLTDQEDAGCRMELPRAPLEDWMREFYFATTIDLGSSGVQCWSLGELRRLLGIDVSELDAIALDDSGSYGAPGLRRALADRLVGGNTDRVMVTHGSSEAIFAVMNALLRAGDEVICVDPAYHSLWSVPRSIGCRLVPWQLRWQDGFAPDLDDLMALITPRTRLVVVNFPHNPTGVTLTKPQFDALLDIVAASGAYLLWDGAFAELTYGTEPLPDPSMLLDRCVSTGTMSKAYGLPGTRVGWCLGPPDLLAQLTPLRDVLTICLSPLAEFIAERAVDGADILLAIRRPQAAHNLDKLATWTACHGDVVEWIRPRGGCTAFPRINRLTNTDELCRRLGREQEVLLVPGSCFGKAGHVRLGFGGSKELFAAGLTRLQHALKDSMGRAA